MKDKLFDPARMNEQAPAEGMAAVNTHMPEEETIGKAIAEQEKPDSTKEESNTDQKDHEATTQ